MKKFMAILLILVMVLSSIRQHLWSVVNRRTDINQSRLPLLIMSVPIMRMQELQKKWLV